MCAVSVPSALRVMSVSTAPMLCPSASLPLLPVFTSNVMFTYLRFADSQRATKLTGSVLGGAEVCSLFILGHSTLFTINTLTGADARFCADRSVKDAEEEEELEGPDDEPEAEDGPIADDEPEAEGGPDADEELGADDGLRAEDELGAA